MGNFKAFCPKGKQFAFNLNAYSCFEVATGQCLLESDKDFIEDHKDLPGKWVSSRCFTIYELMKEGKLPPPAIVEFSCGHYEVPDGQHRTCIAGKTNMEITIEHVKLDGELCDWCKNPDSSTNVTSLKKL